MIKINLIADDRRPRVAQSRRVPKLSVSKEDLAQVLIVGAMGGQAGRVLFDNAIGCNHRLTLAREA